MHVAIVGDYAFVSEVWWGGRVHVFYRWEGGTNNWGWTQTILPPDGDTFYFGSTIYAWGNKLAISRRAHERDLFGTNVCFDIALFMYRLDDLGQWIEDGMLGNDLISDPSCDKDIRSIAGDGSTLIVRKEIVDELYPWTWAARLVVYQTVTEGNWNLESTWTTTATDVCISGDTIINGSNLFTTEGNEIGNFSSGTIYHGTNDHRTLEISEGVLAIAQRGGQDGNNTEGKVILRDIQQPGFPIIDSIAIEGSQYFANSISFAGNYLLATEGSALSALHVFVYQRSSITPYSWALIHIFNIDFGYSGTNYRPLLDVSMDGLMIMSTEEDPGNSLPIEHEVTIRDLSIPVGIDANENILNELEVRRVGDNVFVCNSRRGPENEGYVAIYDMMGRKYAAFNTSRSCSSGIDLSDLPHGIYLVELRSKNSRSSIKLQW